jgi:hypothetical protein
VHHQCVSTLILYFSKVFELGRNCLDSHFLIYWRLTMF